MIPFHSFYYFQLRVRLDVSRANFAEMCQLSDRTLYAIENSKSVSINTHKCLINFFINYGLLPTELVVPLVMEWNRCFDLNQDLHLSQMSPEAIKEHIELRHKAFKKQHPEEYKRVKDLLQRCRK